MTHKEFVAELATRLGYTSKDTAHLMSVLVGEISNQLEEENSVMINGFGTFDVKKKLERVVVNPSTKQRMLVPPKLVINFKATTQLRSKAKNGTE